MIHISIRPLAPSSFVAILLWCIAEATCPAQTTESTLDQTYPATRAEVVAHYGPNDIGLDGQPGGPQALDRAWTLISTFAADYLSTHPRASEAEFQEAMVSLDPGLDKSQLLPLGSDSYLVEVEWQDDILGGNVFIIGPRAGKLQALWNIKDASPNDSDAAQIVRVWSVSALLPECHQRQTRLGFCGPIQGLVGLLPDASNRVHRFYVMGIAAGATETYQFGSFTVWQWNGKGATPILAKVYSWVPAVDDPKPKFDGKFLWLDYMDEYKGFAKWPISTQRNTRWAIEVTPTDIRDAGLTPYEPELDVLDELVVRLQDKRATADIAAPAVAAAMTELMTGPDSRAGRVSITATAITRQPKRPTILCATFPPDYVTNNRDRVFRFVLVPVRGQNFISAVSENDDAPCPR